VPFLDTNPDALIKVVAIASGLGSSSAYSWLKLPTSDRMDEVAAATTLPILMLGGEPKGASGDIFDQWSTAMKEPNIRGLTAGRTLLYPSDGDSETAAVRAGAIVPPHPALTPGPKGPHHTITTPSPHASPPYHPKTTFLAAEISAARPRKVK